jgi:hypothetical protein
MVGGVVKMNQGAVIHEPGYADTDPPL